MDKFLAADIRDVIQLCGANFYDFIIVGSGIGGGVLARTLIENSNGKRVLLIEQGGLAFSTHCLNTPRPHWNHNIREGPSQDNDIVYRAVKETISTVTSDSYEYVGGPVHCIGGRANVWGLYAPKMHEAETKRYFPEAVRSYLFDRGGYDNAYRLLANDPQASLDQPYPDNGAVSPQTVGNMNQIIKDLNDGTKGSGCSFNYSALAAEFTSRNHDQELYQFPMGAFSTVNWILSRVYNKDERLTVLSRTQVLTVNHKDGKSSIDSLTARDSSGVERRIPVGKAAVVLSAGTIGSSVIALRSGIGNGNSSDENYNLVGKGLMDHDIWGTRLEILQGEDVLSLNNEPLKLQSWVKFDPKEDYVLLNVTVNACTFLGQTQEERFPTIYLDESLKPMLKIDFKDALGRNNQRKSTAQVVFEFCAPLDDSNRVLNIPEPTPTIQIQHLKDNSKYIPSMQLLAQAIGTVLAAQLTTKSPRLVKQMVTDMKPRKQQVSDPALNPPCSQFCCESPAPCCINPIALAQCSCFWSRQGPCPCSQGTRTWPPKTQLVPLPDLSKAGFGVVAHEVGTMRMKKDGAGVVDENLRLNGVDNLYVCDLSVFPVSPAANPTLTLAALAQRLGNHLLGRD
jgi:choline dehydrogenase-like flavoprotein